MKPIVLAAAMLGLFLAAGPVDAGPAMAAGDGGQGMLVADGHSYLPPPPRHWRQYNESRSSDRNTVFRPLSPRTPVPGTGVNSMPRPLAPRMPAGQQVYRPAAPRQYTPGTGVNSMRRPPAGPKRYARPPHPGWPSQRRPHR